MVEHPTLNELRYQRAMMNLAIDDVLEDDPIQQALVVTARGKPGKSVELSIDRYFLADL